MASDRGGHPPVDFIARLAALVPKPRVNLTRFHGVLAPNHRWRGLVTPAKRGKGVMCPSDNDVVYLWENTADPGVFKVGITSDSMGGTRIRQCCAHNAMEARIIFMLKVPDARNVESQLLRLGTDPGYGPEMDGYTEFRALTDQELGQAVKIAYDMASGST